MRILLVDDSPFNLTFFRSELHKAGYADIVTANSAKEAFRILGLPAEGELNRPPQTAPVDMILMDIEMPEMTGIEACRRIKSFESYSDIPVIFVTASKKHLDAAFEAGGIDFIEKSSERVELLARVKSALSLKKEMDERKSRERKLRRELQLAKQIQRSVLSPPIAADRIHIHSVYVQSDEVSGDMFYWNRLDEHRYGVILIDVAGHGLSSALISMSIRSLLSELVNLASTPEQLYLELNRRMNHLYGGGKRLTYFTAICALINTDLRTIEYFNAGHPPGLLLTRSGATARLSGNCVPIGMKREASCRPELIRYEAGTRLVLYTDGLVETPGQPLSAGIAMVEEAALAMLEVDNASFVERIARLKDRATDDVCVISVALA